MSTTIIYGIPNCDTMKKARKWLEEHGVDYEFHNYKTQGVNPVQLRHWIDQNGWESIVNKRGTTWRKLPDSARNNMDATLATVVLEEQPSMIKRPILETRNQTIIGFDAERYAKIFLN